jgi:hypothetical protein
MAYLTVRTALYLGSALLSPERQALALLPQSNQLVTESNGVV